MSVNLIQRTHKVTRKRQDGEVVGPNGGRTPNMVTQAEDEQWNLQPTSGVLRHTESGLVAESQHLGLCDFSVDVEQNDVLIVTDGAYNPTTLRIESVGLQGPGWDTECELEEVR